MEYSKIIQIERKLAFIHKLFLLYAILVTMSVWIWGKLEWEHISLLVDVGIIIVDYFVLYRKIPSQKVIFVQKYLQIYLAVMTFALAYIAGHYLYSICLFFLVLSLIEYFLLFGYHDRKSRMLYIASAAIALVFAPMLFFYFMAPSQSNISYFYMVNLFLLLAVIVITDVISMLVKDMNEKLHAQARLIGRINEANEELLENQLKIKRANELLGIQKHQLEVANAKVNSVNAEIKIQNDIVNYISSALEIDELMKLITESIIDFLDMDICAIVLYPDETMNESIRYQIRTKIEDKSEKMISTYIEQYCFEPYLGNNRTFIDNRVQIKKYPFMGEKSVGSIVISPLLKEEKRIGALLVGHRDYDFFEEREAFFEAVMSQLLIALDNARLYAKMEYMANRDALTGIYNRGHLTSLYKNELNKAILHQTKLSVALFDIDHFKKINDSYGHLLGDRVIQMIAEIANQLAVGHGGLCGRYGGEEFVILFPNKGLQHTVTIMEQLRENIEQTAISHNHEEIYVQVSIGVTSYPETCINPSELLNHADWAMYYSKQTGRNRITIDSEEVRRLVHIE